MKKIEKGAKNKVITGKILHLDGDRKYSQKALNYYKKMGGQNATPENLISIFEDTSHKRLKSIFESYINGSTIIGNIKDNGNNQ